MEVSTELPFSGIRYPFSSRGNTPSKHFVLGMCPIAMNTPLHSIVSFSPVLRFVIEILCTLPSSSGLIFSGFVFHNTLILGCSVARSAIILDARN